MTSQYEAPRLTLVGTVEHLTGAVSGGRRLDRAAKAGDIIADLPTS